MQLVAYGAQDIYLTGNPQITFFKVVYRRHTNFSMEAIEQTWNGDSGAASVVDTTSRCTATIARNGDLVHRMYLEIVGTPDATDDKDNVTTHCINNITIEIGGQQIDKHSGEWMETWAELTEPNPSAHCGLVGGAVQTGTVYQNMSGSGGCTLDDIPVKSRFFLPLQFWFCRNPGLALPLIALQYHEVKVILEANWYNGYSGTSDFSQTLYCDYIYLDTDERRRFAQVSHEYLIEQVQEQTLGTPDGSNELNFNHPVKELIWCEYTAQSSSNTTWYPQNLSGVEGTQTDVDVTYQLKLNGHDRFSARNVSYFTKCQVWQHHSGVGGIIPHAGGDAGSASGGAFSNGLAVYSFALKPEEHQPSGTCNFSRIDNAQLVCGGAGTGTANLIFAVNYNVLRIMSGMGGLAYSN